MAKFSTYKVTFACGCARVYSSKDVDVTGETVRHYAGWTATADGDGTYKAEGNCSVCAGMRRSLPVTEAPQPVEVPGARSVAVAALACAVLAGGLSRR